MEQIKTQNWNGHRIRFVQKGGDWWAVAKDVAEALGYANTRDAVRAHVEAIDKNTVAIHDGIQGNPNAVVVSEFGIYDLVFQSKLPSAKSFKRWVYTVIKSLRQSSGLEGFEVFRMLDKQHQRDAMKRLQESLRTPVKVDYIKANTIADKAVSIKHGHSKMLKKSEMTPDMIRERQALLDDTVSLMSLNERYKLNISISQTIYKN